MKIKFTILILMASLSILKGQNILTVTYDAAKPVGSQLVPSTTSAQASAFDPAQPITVNVINAPASTNIRASYNLLSKTASGTLPTWILSPLSVAEIASYSSYQILINTPNESFTYQNVAKPAMTQPSNSGLVTSNKFPTNSAASELSRFFPSISPTDFGLEINSSSLIDYPYLGKKYTHIFLDQFGNLLLGAIPQGISNRQYIVHIIYLTNKARPQQISYSINQSKGSYSPTLVFNGDGQLSKFGVQANSGVSEAVEYIWAHQQFSLRTSTNNIEFEAMRNILNDKSLLSNESTIVAKHTIEMSTVLHGSFDIGLLRTNLSNPTFELIASSNNQNVVKQSNSGNRGTVTAMATLYTSPIILLEKYLFGIDVPNYKLTGRNFLDDHKIYERIFPAVGVSISDKAFKNLFFGLNWELARGASVFAGIHYGEINTFNAGDNFKFLETNISESEFNLRTNKKWKSDFTFGANLDILVVTNLFRQK